jgi:hypothetical protein
MFEMIHGTWLLVLKHGTWLLVHDARQALVVNCEYATADALEQWIFSGKWQLSSAER